MSLSVAISSRKLEYFSLIGCITPRTWIGEGIQIENRQTTKYLHFAYREVMLLFDFCHCMKLFFDKCCFPVTRYFWIQEASRRMCF